jgi:peptide/nickel transport system permease protein
VSTDLLTGPTVLEDVAPRRRLRSGLRRPLALIGLVIVVAWMLLALLAPWVAPYDPLAQDFLLFESPSRAHPFGTDELGRDVLSRVIYGSRLSLPLAVLLVSLSILIGGVLGSVAGYFRSLPDAVVMRTVDLVFAFPAIILAMVVTASLGPNVRNAVLAIVVVSWPAYARVVRGLVLSLGDSQFVQSSRLLGSSSRRTLVRDILPNLAGPVIVLGTLDLANAILLLSGLSFLGLGAQPPTPEWGSMVAVGTQNFQFWWVGMFPGLAIFTAVLAFNFLGDSLRDRFDPRGHARETRRGRA